MPRPTTTSLGFTLGTRPPGTPILPALGGTPKILAAGDSITIGNGSTDGGGYRTLLDARLGEAGLARQWVGPTIAAGLAHYGNSGWTVSQLNAGIGAVITTYDPDILLLNIGRNNMDDAGEAAAAPGDYTTLLSTIFAAKPTLRIVAGQITPEENATWWARTQTFRAALTPVLVASAAYAAGLLLIAGAGLELVPLTRAHLGDGVHPNDIGYSLMTDAWWPYLVNAYGLPASW